MEEIWKPVVGYEGLYEVSSLGNVKSLPRNGTSKNGRMLRKCNDSDGYEIITLANVVHKIAKVHRLVAKAFIINPENKSCVNHIDNCRSNNILTNIEWATTQENTTYMVKQGRQYKAIGRKRNPETGQFFKE